MEIEFLHLAALEVDDAFGWYEGIEPGLGNDLIHDLDHVVHWILRYPFFFPERLPACRKAPLKRFPYVVWYEVTPERVVVYAFAHDSRNPDYWIERRV